MKLIPFYETPVFWLFCFSIFIKNVSYSQANLNKNSNNSQISMAKWEQEENLASLFQCVKNNQNTSIEIAKYCAKKAYSLAEKNGTPIQIAESTFWLSLIKYKQEKNPENFALSITQMNRATDIFSKNRKSLWEARSLDLLTELNLRYGDIPAAEKSLNKAFDVIDASDQSRPDWIETKAKLNVTKATYLSKIQVKDSLISLYLESAMRLYEKIGDTTGLALVNLNTVILLKDFDEKYASYKRLIELYSHLDYPDKIAATYCSLGEELIQHYSEVKQKSENLGQERWFNEGISYLKKALELNEGCEFEYELAFAYHTHAFFLFKNEDNFSGYTYADSANYHYSQAIDRASLDGDIECLKKSIEGIMATCVLNNSCDKVGKRLNTTFSNIFDDLKENREKINNYEISLVEQQEKQKRQTLATILGGLFLISIFGFATYTIRKRVKEKQLENQRQLELKEKENKAIKLEQEKLETELKLTKSEIVALKARQEASRAQMSPHFISNTLNSIDYLINFGEREEASNYLVEFSDLARMTLEFSRQPKISLKEELSFIETFLSLEKLRIGEKLTYEIEVEETLNTTAIEVPPLLLQPFVENAILHGIQPKEKKGKINIQIKTFDTETLEFVVEDNGIGRNRSRELKKNSKMDHQSLAMTLMEEQLTTSNNEGNTPFNVIDLTDNENKGMGTKVIIRLKM